MSAQPGFAWRTWDGFWEGIAWYMRGRRPAPPRKMSPTYLLNLISGTFLVGVILLNLAFAHVSIRVNPLDDKCIEGTVFFEWRHVPDVVERGSKLSFVARGLPVIDEGAVVGKYVAAIPGDVVVVDGSGISINGEHWGPIEDRVIEKTRTDRSTLFRSFTVGADEVLMLGDLPGSFDGRYFGPIKQADLAGRIWRIW